MNWNNKFTDVAMNLKSSYMEMNYKFFGLNINKKFMTLRNNIITITDPCTRKQIIAANILNSPITFFDIALN